MAIANEAGRTEQLMRAQRKLVQEGVDALAQGVPVVGQPMEVEHILAQESATTSRLGSARARRSAARRSPTAAGRTGLSARRYGDGSTSCPGRHRCAWLRHTLDPAAGKRR